MINFTSLNSFVTPCTQRLHHANIVALADTIYNHKKEKIYVASLNMWSMLFVPCNSSSHRLAPLLPLSPVIPHPILTPFVVPRILCR